MILYKNGEVPLVIVKGDDLSIALQIRIWNEGTNQFDDAAFGGATSVKAVITDIAFAEAKSPVVELNNADIGSDWGRGRVILTMPAAESSIIDIIGRCALQLTVEDAGKKTHLMPGVEVVNSLTG